MSGDENDASINAMEAGITKVVTATYPVMKMTRVSLQWKREYSGITISFTAMEAGITKAVTATCPVMKMTRVSLQWKRE